MSQNFKVISFVGSDDLGGVAADTVKGANADLAFIEYIIECFETRTDIRPTVFVRYVPDGIKSTVRDVLTNIGNALEHIPVLIYGGESLSEGTRFKTCDIDLLHAFANKNKMIGYTSEVPIIFGINLLGLFKHNTVNHMRKLLSAGTSVDWGQYWVSIAGGA